jgi:hypothetical protein
MAEILFYAKEKVRRENSLAEAGNLKRVNFS